MQKYIRHSRSIQNILNSAIHWFLCNCEIISTLYGGVYGKIGNPAYCLALYLTGVHFQGKLQHVGDVSKQKIKCGPTRTRESDTQCQIARRTICYRICQTREYQTHNAGLTERWEQISKANESGGIIKETVLLERLALLERIRYSIQA